MDALGFRIETPTVTEPWRKVLSDAADYIEAHGWCPIGASDGDKVCALLATVRVAGYTLPQESACHRMRQHISSDSIATWNDAPGRTAAEVCAALRSCAVQP